MNFKKTWKRGTEGFTLVELIVVIAILAILAGIAVPAYSGYIKKANEAADMQMLGAVNTAFAAAVLENGRDVSDVSSAIIADAPVGYSRAAAEESSWTVGGISSVVFYSGKTPANFDVAEFSAAFMRYLGDTNVTFKVISRDELHFVDGAFTNDPDKMPENIKNAYNNILTNMSTQVGTVQGSAFATIGAAPLLNQVNGITGLAAESLLVEDSTLWNVVFDENGTYAANLAATLDMSVTELETFLAAQPDGGVQFLANSTVLTVAKTVNDPAQMNRNDMINLLKSGSYGEIGTAIQKGDAATGLANAAMLYGMYTAYNPSGAANLNSTAGLTALKDDEGFQEYLSKLGTEGSQAQKDFDGYMAALEIVNNTVEDSPETATQVMQNGYNDPNLLNLMQQVMGN